MKETNELYPLHEPQTVEPDDTEHELSDQELLQSCRDGHVEAFGTLWQRHQQHVLARSHTAMRHTYGMEDAEDVAQDTALRLLYEIRRPHSSLEFQSREHAARRYLGTIACNRAVDIQRSADQRYVSRNAATPGEDMRSASPSSEDQVLIRLTEHDVESQLTALESTSTKQAEVLRQRFIQERSVAEVADSLGIRQEAVKALQWRGLKALRRQYDKESLRHMQ